MDERVCEEALLGKRYLSLMYQAVREHNTRDLVDWLATGGAQYLNVPIQGEEYHSGTVPDRAAPLVCYAAQHHDDFNQLLHHLLPYNPQQVEYTSPDGYGVLHYALSSRYGSEQKINTIKFFLARGVKIDSNSPQGTILHQAVCSHDRHMCQFLLAREANPNEGRMTDGVTPLHEAVSQGDSVVVWGMLACMSDVSARDILGRTALHRATENRNDQLFNIIKMLVDKGSSVEDRDTSGHTPLDYALRHNNIAAAKFLLEHGTNPFIQNSRGKSSFTDLVTNDDLVREVIQYLRLSKAYPNMYVSWKKGGIDPLRIIAQTAQEVESLRNVLQSSLFLSSRVLDHEHGLYREMKDMLRA